MQLPGAERAFIDRRKLVDYCLSLDHPQGKHKARAFERALGFSAYDVDEGEAEIRVSVLSNEAVAGRIDSFGHRDTVDFAWERAGHVANIRTAWILKHGWDLPSLTTCHVL